mgnify:CR=1 FL=1
MVPSLGDDKSLEDLYQTKILEFAREARKLSLLTNHDVRFISKNPLCGDLVEVRINIINKSIKNLSAKVRGCALCEASAGLVVNYFSNKNLPINDFMEHFNKWLSKIHDNYPDELPEELKIFSPIQDIKNRHTCVKMPFEAFFKSIKNS